MLTRAFLPKDTLIYPELENGAFSTFVKDQRFLQFQVKSAVPLILNGMTYDIFDFVGNGRVEKLGYGKAVKALTPYLQGVMDAKVSFDALSKVILPVSEKSCYDTYT